MMEEIISNIEKHCPLDENTRPIAEEMVKRGFDSGAIVKHIQQKEFCY